MTNKPIEISEEAREAANQLHPQYTQEWYDQGICRCPHCQYKVKESDNERNTIATAVQLAINSSTEKLTAENERLKEENRSMARALAVFERNTGDF